EEEEEEEEEEQEEEEQEEEEEEVEEEEEGEVEDEDESWRGEDEEEGDYNEHEYSNDQEKIRRELIEMQLRAKYVKQEQKRRIREQRKFEYCQRELKEREQARREEEERIKQEKEIERIRREKVEEEVKKKQAQGQLKAMDDQADMKCRTFLFESTAKCQIETVKELFNSTPTSLLAPSAQQQQLFGNKPLPATSAALSLELWEHFERRKDGIGIVSLKLGNKETLLHVAVKARCLDLLFFFIEKGAPLLAVDNLGRTPLHVVAEDRNTVAVEIARILVDSGPLRYVDTPVFSTQRTALHYAAAKGNAEMVEFLLEHHARMNLLDIDGLTPEGLANNKLAQLEKVANASSGRQKKELMPKVEMFRTTLQQFQKAAHLLRETQAKRDGEIIERKRRQEMKAKEEEMKDMEIRRKQEEKLEAEMKRREEEECELQRLRTATSMNGSDVGGGLWVGDASGNGANGGRKRKKKKPKGKGGITNADVAVSMDHGDVQTENSRENVNGSANGSDHDYSQGQAHESAHYQDLANTANGASVTDQAYFGMTLAPHVSPSIKHSSPVPTHRVPIPSPSHTASQYIPAPQPPKPSPSHVPVTPIRPPQSIPFAHHIPPGHAHLWLKSQRVQKTVNGIVSPGNSVNINSKVVRERVGGVTAKMPVKSARRDNGAKSTVNNTDTTVGAGVKATATLPNFSNLGAMATATRQIRLPTTTLQQPYDLLSQPSHQSLFTQQPQATLSVASANVKRQTSSTTPLPPLVSSSSSTSASSSSSRLSLETTSSTSSFTPLQARSQKAKDVFATVAPLTDVNTKYIPSTAILQTFVSMGFLPDRAKRALIVTGGKVEDAVEMLTSGIMDKQIAQEADKQGENRQLCQLERERKKMTGKAKDTVQMEQKDKDQGLYFIGPPSSNSTTLTASAERLLHTIKSLSPSQPLSWPSAIEAPQIPKSLSPSFLPKISVKTTRTPVVPTNQVSMSAAIDKPVFGHSKIGESIPAANPMSLFSSTATSTGAIQPIFTTTMAAPVNNLSPMNFSSTHAPSPQYPQLWSNSIIGTGPQAGSVMALSSTPPTAGYGVTLSLPSSNLPWEALSAPSALATPLQKAEPWSVNQAVDANKIALLLADLNTGAQDTKMAAVEVGAIGVAEDSSAVTKLGDINADELPGDIKEKSNELSLTAEKGEAAGVSTITSHNGQQPQELVGMYTRPFQPLFSPLDPWYSSLTDVSTLSVSALNGRGPRGQPSSGENSSNVESPLHLSSGLGGMVLTDGQESTTNETLLSSSLLDTDKITEPPSPPRPGVGVIGSRSVNSNIAIAGAKSNITPTKEIHNVLWGLSGGLGGMAMDGPPLWDVFGGNDFSPGGDFICAHGVEHLSYQTEHGHPQSQQDIFNALNLLDSSQPLFRQHPVSSCTTSFSSNQYYFPPARNTQIPGIATETFDTTFYRHAASSGFLSALSSTQSLWNSSSVPLQGGEGSSGVGPHEYWNYKDVYRLEGEAGLGITRDTRQEYLRY
ncbi:hypothetical protein BC937DRAFT_92757, partial [Endogone sp. FLAS-F59071]